MLPFPVINKTTVIPKGSIKKIVIGATNMTILGTDGTLMGYGSNVNGSLGTGSTSSVINWYDATTISDVRDIFQNGSDSSVAIKNDGTIWFCGIHRNQQFGSPVLPTSPITSYINISDRIPISGNDVLDVKFTYNLVSFLMVDGSIYSTDGTFGGTAITGTGYTGWKKSTPPVHLVKFDTYSSYSGYNPVYVGLDIDGHAYAIGYNGWKQIDGTTTSSYSVWTPTIPTKTFKDIKADISNAFLFLSTDNIVYYSGISGVVNPANVNNTINGYAAYNGSSSSAVNPVFIVTSTSGQYHIRRNGQMWGSFANNQAPVAITNTGNQSSTLQRTLPDTNTAAIEYCLSSGASKSMVLYYGGTSGNRKLYGLGGITGNSTATTFTQIQLPSKYA